MHEVNQAAGILIVSHGSPRAETNRRFEGLVERVAARLSLPHVLPTFFSIARPNIADRVAELAARGVREIVLAPYFLGEGQHVTHDMPALLDECRQSYPHVTFRMLPTLENEPAIEDLLVDRLAPLAPRAAQPADGPAIQRQSFEIIERQLAGWPADTPAARWIVRRAIHATADVSFGRSLRIHPNAVDAGRAALATKRPIVCDVRMLQAGITCVANEVLCAIDDEETLALAKQAGCTRAAAAIQRLAAHLEGAIVAIGNAPTALWKVLELAAGGGPRPALVVGLPVGFVGARESKLALLESDLCWITNTTSRGGSPVAAAVVNALATWEAG